MLSRSILFSGTQFRATCVILLLTLIALVFVTKTSCAQNRKAPKVLPASSESKLAPRAQSEQQVINAYRKTNESVVNISTQTTSLDFFGPVYQEGAGSGVIIDAQEGLLITNSHVIANARRIAVTLANGKSYPVKIVGLDPGIEMALLRITAKDSELVAAEFGDSSLLEVGQRVIAIGNPFGLQRTLTTGIISSLGRTIRAEDGRLIEDIIQTDAAINPGNSGGPLLDTAGRVVGINTAIVSRSGESAGIGFAIPVNQIKKALPQLLKYGHVRRPKMGVVLETTNYGIAVLYVHPGTPADKAGLQGARRAIKLKFFSGYKVDISDADFIIEINDTAVRTKDEVATVLGKVDPEENIKLLIRRGLDKTNTRTVKLKPMLE